MSSSQTQHARLLLTLAVSLRAGVTYLMDPDGKVVASSDRSVFIPAGETTQRQVTAAEASNGLIRDSHNFIKNYFNGNLRSVASGGHSMCQPAARCSFSTLSKLQVAIELCMFLPSLTTLVLCCCAAPRTISCTFPRATR